MDGFINALAGESEWVVQANGIVANYELEVLVFSGENAIFELAYA